LPRLEEIEDAVGRIATFLASYRTTWSTR